MTNNESLKHFGVLGMKWGRKKGTTSQQSNGSKKYSKEEKKLIKDRKNKLLNEVVDVEVKIDKHVNSSKLKTSLDDVYGAFDDAYGGPSPHLNKVLSAHMLERASTSNAFLKANPSLVPKGMTITYDPKKFDGDDFSMHPDYTYNGKKVDFTFGKISEKDSVFLEEPMTMKQFMNSESNSLSHYGVLGMKWGKRKGPIRPSNPSEDHLRKQAITKKRVSEMSNAELQAVNNRLILEKQYRDLTKADVNPGVKYAKTLLGTYGKKQLDTIATKALDNAVDTLISKGLSRGFNKAMGG